MPREADMRGRQESTKTIKSIDERRIMLTCVSNGLQMVASGYLSRTGICGHLLGEDFNKHFQYFKHFYHFEHFGSFWTFLNILNLFSNISISLRMHVTQRTLCRPVTRLPPRVCSISISLRSISIHFDPFRFISIHFESSINELKARTRSINRSLACGDAVAIFERRTL